MRLRTLRRVFLIFLISLAGVLLLLFAIVNLPFSQRFATRQVNQILEGVQVPIHLDAIRRILPNSVRVEGLTIADPEGDTVIYAGEIDAAIRLLALTRRKVVLHEASLNRADVKLLMDEQAGKLNIEKAFPPGPNTGKPNPDGKKKDWAISIKKASLASIRFQMTDSLSGIHILQEIGHAGIRDFSLPLEEREIRARSMELRQANGYVMIHPSKEKKTGPKKGLPWNYELLNLDMDQVDFTFDQGPEAILLHVMLGEGELRAKEVDVPGRVIDIRKIALSETYATVLRPSRIREENRKTSNFQRPGGQSISHTGPDKFSWFVQGREIDLEEAGFSILSRNEPAGDSSAYHFEVSGLETRLRDFIWDDERAGLKVNRMSFDLNNGFSLSALKGELDSDSTRTLLDLDIESGNSQARLRGRADRGLYGLISEPGAMGNASLSISRTTLSLRDLLPFMEDFGKSGTGRYLSMDPYNVSGEIELLGPLMDISGFSISQDRHFLLSLEGSIDHPFQIRNARGDLTLALSGVDTTWLKELFRAGGMKNPPPVPAGLSLGSHITRTWSAPEIDLVLDTEMGHLAGSASLDFHTDSFSIRSSFDHILLGEALNHEDLGSFSGSASLEGQGFSPGKSDATLSLIVDSLEYKDYLYTHASLEGMIREDSLNMHLLAGDDFFKADLRLGVIPSDSLRVHASGMLAARLHQLNLSQDTLSIQTSLEGSMRWSRNSLVSEIDARDMRISNAHQSSEIEQVRAVFHTDSVNTGLISKGDFFDLEIQLTEPIQGLDSLGHAYVNYLGTFRDPDHLKNAERVQELPEIHATGHITDDDVLDILLQDTGFHITSLDLTLRTSITENRIHYGVRGIGLKYKVAEIESLDAAIVDSAGIVDMQVHLDETSLLSGPLTDWELQATVSNWRGTAGFSVTDRAEKLLYDLEIAARVDTGQLVLEIPARRMILNGQEWHTETEDLMSMDLANLEVSPALRMHTDSSSLYLLADRVGEVPEFKLILNRLEMESLVRKDLVPGRPDASISGNVDFSIPGDSAWKVDTDLRFTGVDYSDLRFDSVSLAGSMERTGSGFYSMDVSARLDSATIDLKGQWLTSGERRQIESEIFKVPINVIQPFTGESLSDLTGSISGKLLASSAGSADQVNGSLSFSGVGLKINALNSTFRIPDQELSLTDEKLVLNQFRIRDTMNNELMVDGTLDFEVLDRINANLNISSSRLQVMSRGREEEQKDVPFYGDVYVDSDFRVTGPLDNPTIRGNIRLSRGTEVFYRHTDDLSLSESEKIVNFVGGDLPGKAVAAPVNVRQGALIKSSVETVVQIDPSTAINVGIARNLYELQLQITGGGSLYYNMLSNSQVSLSGSYEINEGSADLKLVGWPDKAFTIAKGGYIRWDGRLEEPELNVTASARVPSSYLNPMDGKQRPVDFNVILRLSGYLSELDVLFTINTPDQYLMSTINTLSPEEKMRQAISILLFRSIDLPGISSSSDYMSQQVNQLLSNQLNQLTQSAFKGVDISFGIDTYSSNAQGQGSQTSTSLSYEVRKSLMNDRAQIEVSGRMGDVNRQPGASDLALSNIAFEYSLDSAATKFLKVYNEHTYDDVFEGEVIKTGIGFTFRKRYRSFGDIWKREENKKQNKQKKP